MANTMLLPIFPQMRKTLGLSLQEISLMFVIVSFTAAFLNPLGGILADKWGRKKIVVPSIFIYGAAGGLVDSVATAENPFRTVLFSAFTRWVRQHHILSIAVALAGDMFRPGKNQGHGLSGNSKRPGKTLQPGHWELRGCWAGIPLFSTRISFRLPFILVLYHGTAAAEKVSAPWANHIS